jgi:hypothetical protein
MSKVNGFIAITKDNEAISVDLKQTLEKCGIVILKGTRMFNSMTNSKYKEEIKAHKRREYYARPEIQEKRKKYYERDDVKQKRLEYGKQEAVKARKRESHKRRSDLIKKVRDQNPELYAQIMFESQNGSE